MFRLDEHSDVIITNWEILKLSKDLCYSYSLLYGYDNKLNAY